MLKLNGAFRAVRFTEVVRISEGPLREIPLRFDTRGVRQRIEDNMFAHVFTILRVYVNQGWLELDFCLYM